MWTGLSWIRPVLERKCGFSFSRRGWGKENGVKPVPEMFTALEDQLGLTLKPAEEPVEFLVIDRAVQLP